MKRNLFEIRIKIIMWYLCKMATQNTLGTYDKTKRVTSDDKFQICDRCLSKQCLQQIKSSLHLRISE